MKGKFAVKRSEWLRGEPEESRLLRIQDGKKCCLGFFCLQSADLSSSQIGGFLTPSLLLNHLRDDGLSEGIKDLVVPADAPYTGFRWKNSPLTKALMKVNDDDSTDDDYKEWEITRLFAEAGYEVEFID